MTYIDELESNLKKLLDNNELILTAPIIKSNGFQMLLNDILKNDKIIIKNTQISREDGLRVTGRSCLFGIDNVELNINFYESNKDLIIEMAGTFPTGCDGFSIPVSSWLKLSDIRVEFKVPNNADEVLTTIRGAVLSGNIKIPIIASMKGDMGNFLFTGDFDKVSISSLSDLIHLIGDNNDLQTINNFKNLGNLYISEISALIDPEKKSLVLLSMTVGLSNQWDLISDHFSIIDPKLKLQINYPTDSILRNYLISINGTVKANQTLVPIYLIFGNRSYWSIGGNFECLSMPGLSDLLDLAGCSEVGAYFPSGFLDIKNIKLYNLEVGFDPKKRSLSSVQFVIKAQDTWKFPEISNISLRDIDLDLKYVKQVDGNASKINGSINGTMDICSTQVLISGVISDTFVLTSKIPKLSLSAIINQFMQGFSFPSAIPDLEFSNLDLSVTPKTGEFSFSGNSASPWKIPLGFETAEISDVFLSINRTAQAGGQQKTVSGEIKGKMKLGSVSFDMDCKFPGEFVLQGKIAQMNLLGLADELLDSLDLPADLPDFIFKDIDIRINPQKGMFDISGRSFSSWSLPLGAQGLQMQDLFLKASRSAKPGGVSQVSARIAGTFMLAGTSVTVDVQLEKDGLVLSGKVPKLGVSSLVQDLCGNQAVQGTLMPPGIQNLEISDLAIFLDIKDRTFAVSCKSAIGEVELMVKKVETSWGFMFGLVPPETWKFSAISQDLKSLDAIKFHNTAVIVSSANDSSFSLTRVKSPRKDLKIIKGVNLFFGMDLSSVKADKILGKTDLEIYAAVGTKLSDLVLEAKLAGNIKISEGLILGGVIFRLKPDPSNFSLQLLCVLRANLSDNVLEFTGAIIIGAQSAEMAATMLGVWNRPLGFEGIAIANVALALGISYATALPTIGIAGSLQVGDFKGSAAVRFDTGAPTKTMVAVDFNRLYLMDVLRTFCNPSMGTAIPPEVAKTVLNIGFEDAKVYIVPQTTQIGELKYEQGLRLGSKMFFQGIRGYADLDINYAEGIDVKGDIDVIDLLGLFILRGANGKPKAALALSIKPKTNPIPVINMNGEVVMLGLARSADIQFSKDGFFFKIAGKIFDLFEASLEIRGDISKLQGIYVKAYMKNDLFTYMRERALKFIDDNTKSAVGSLTRAQNDIKAAQGNVNGLLPKIDQMRATVNNERQKARNDLQSAQQKLTNAQNSVNSLQDQINQTKGQIRSYENEIAWWNSWYNNSRWYQKAYRWAQLAYEVGWRGTAIAGLYAKIGGLEVAKLTAIGVLEAAKSVLRGLEELTRLPVDADPRVLALLTAYATATTALNVANGALEGLKRALGGMARVASFIIDVGLGGIIDIRGAQFEGCLSLAKDRKFSLRVDLSFMKGPIQTYQISFDFNDPIGSTLSLVKMLIPLPN